MKCDGTIETVGDNGERERRGGTKRERRSRKGLKDYAEEAGMNKGTSVLILTSGLRKANRKTNTACTAAFFFSFLFFVFNGTATSAFAKDDGARPFFCLFFFTLPCLFSGIDPSKGKLSIYERYCLCRLKRELCCFFSLYIYIYIRLFLSASQACVCGWAAEWRRCVGGRQRWVIGGAKRKGKNGLVVAMLPILCSA